MPSKSAKQARFMAAVCKGGKTTKKISKKVACDFHKADKKKGR